MSIELPEIIIKKLDFIDRCRKRFSLKVATTLQLPQIIAVGDQSSGKSSILEAISGIKLPKGQNTVTKRPIVVQMRRGDSNTCSIRCGNDIYEKVLDVESKIKNVQGNEVSKDPIFVDVQSPNLPPLTIIDLPGIVKQAIRGQAESIVQSTRDVAKHYMDQENSLILCVVPSNVDFNTIDTINFASECDRDKSRTVGVLTKLDKLALEEVDAKLSILKNITKPLKKGYYGLILTDSILSTDVNGRDSKERAEFSKLGKLWNECESNLGLKNFTNKLVEELVTLIDLRLPILKSDMENFLKDTTTKLGAFSDLHANQSNQRKYLIEIKDKVLTTVDNALVKGCDKLVHFPKCASFLVDKGFIKIESDQRHDTFLYGQHQIFTKLLSNFTRHFKDNFKLTNSKYSIQALQEMSDKCSTEHIPIFMSSEPFKDVVKSHLVEFKNHSMLCLTNCLDLAKRFIEDLISEKLISDIPSLRNEFMAKCLDQLYTQHEIATKHLNIIFQSEERCFTQKSLVTTKGVDDRDTPSGSSQIMSPESANSSTQSKSLNRTISNAPMNVVQNIKDGDNRSLTGRDDTKYPSGRKLKETLEEYIQNLINRLADVVPNFIMLNLFEEFQEALRHSLNTYVTNEVVLEHFKLSEEDEMKVTELSQTKDALETSLKELRDLSMRN